MRWGMVIDLKRCSDCLTCVASCKTTNFLPPGVLWNRVYDYEVGEYPSVTRRYLPTVCMQCENPVCKDVCPTGATQQREDGIVYVDYDKCIGCKYCEVSCPYSSRSYFPKEQYYYGDQPTLLEAFPYEMRATYQRFKPGTATKCTFCMERVDKVKDGLKPGIDPEATPICVITCPAVARTFGDLDDPGSEASRLINTRKGYRLFEELGTEPSVWYLPS